MYNAIKKKVYILLHPEIGATKWEKIINIFIITLILLNIIAVMLETVNSIHEPYKQFFRDFDTVSVIIFSIEYILRVWSSNADPKYKHSINGRLRYMVSVNALIDLMAILPWYLQSIVGFDLRVLRILRLLRFFRLFRLTAYTKSVKMVVHVFKSTFNELLLSLGLAVFLIIISSSVIYFAEHGAQPKVFTSIPQTIWWSVTTLTTVGYGDMIPKTVIGKILTSIILLAGVALLALPAGIITAGFLEEIRRAKNGSHIHNGSHVCPHCGMPLEEVEQEKHTS